MAACQFGFFFVRRNSTTKYRGHGRGRSLHSLLLIGAGGSRVIKRNYLRSDLSINCPFYFIPIAIRLLEKEQRAARVASAPPSSPPPSLSWVDSQFS